MRGLETTAKGNQRWNKSGSLGRTRRTQPNAAMRRGLAPNPVSGNEQRGNPKGMNERERRSRQLLNRSTGKTTGNRRATGEEQESTAELSRGGEAPWQNPLCSLPPVLLDDWNPHPSANQSLRLESLSNRCFYKVTGVTKLVFSTIFSNYFSIIRSSSTDLISSK